MSDEPKNKPPYLPYTTFKNVIGNLNKNGIIPARIDKSVLAGQSGGTQSYLWAGFRFFDLMDENKAPTEDLKALAKAEGEQRKEIWRPIFERAYAPIIGDLDLTTATLQMLHERFAAQDLNGETVRKCHSFYAAAAEDAGIVLPPPLKPNTRGGGSGPRKPRKKAAANKVSGEPEDDFANSDPGNGDGESSQTATLLLDREGKRLVKIKAPSTITKAELDRLQQWLSFQLIVEE